MAYKNTLESHFFNVVCKGLFLVIIIASIAVSWRGDSTCTVMGDDPISGRCEEYSDNGYVATSDEKKEYFSFVFTLLFLPLVLGAWNGGKKEKTEHKKV